MKRLTIYKYLYNHSISTYSTIFLLRQIFYFFKGRKAFTEFGKKSLQEHFNF